MQLIFVTFYVVWRGVAQSVTGGGKKVTLLYKGKFLPFHFALDLWITLVLCEMYLQRAKNKKGAFGL